MLVSSRSNNTTEKQLAQIKTRNTIHPVSSAHSCTTIPAFPQNLYKIHQIPEGILPYFPSEDFSWFFKNFFEKSHELLKKFSQKYLHYFPKNHSENSCNNFSNRFCRKSSRAYFGISTRNISSVPSGYCLEYF